MTLECSDLPLHLADDIGQAEQVRVGLFNLSDGFLAVSLKFGDACGLFEDGAAVFWLGRENRVDLPLRHDRVGGRTNAGAHEETVNVAEAGRVLVDEIVALA